MESSPRRPTANAASAALSAAEASRAKLVEGIVLPSWFLETIAVAITVQIATTAAGLGDERPWLMLGGLALFAVVAGVQLLRLRRLNGVWIGGLAGRVALGADALTSVGYALALGLAVWAAYGGRPWAAALCAIAGGVGYALGGRRWLRRYRAQPEAHAGGEPALWLTVLALGAAAGLGLLLLGA